MIQQISVLTSRGAPLQVKGNVYRTCVQRVMVHDSDSWPMNVEDVQRLQGTERSMARRMCGVRLKNRTSSEETEQHVRYCGDYGDCETVSIRIVWSS